MNTLPDPKEVFESSQAATQIELPGFGVVTTTSEIRAVFGLSEAELPDEMLTQRVYSNEVAMTITRIDPSLSMTWHAKLQANPMLHNLLDNFCLYCICNSLCEILPLIAARTLSDSKATFQRFDQDLKQVAASIQSRYSQASRALSDALQATDSAQPTPGVTLFGSGRPRYDRVTGQ